MNVLIATSEVAPFSKTGGLADVCGSLPNALAGLGHQPIVVTPAYRCVLNACQAIEPTGFVFDIPIGSKVIEGTVSRTTMPGTDIPVYLIEQPEYFDRDELYGEGGEDYKDNCERFAFFSRAVMELIRLADLQVDVLHCNDWQTGLIPAYLKIEYHQVPRYEQIATLMTIHNMAYQGRFWHWDMLLTGLDWRYFNWRQMEFWGDLNLLKTGIVFSDAITTVSPRYSQEIQQQPFGCGLEGVLQQRRDILYGIINGVDYDQWNPATDAALATNYTVDDWRQGKTACKHSLQTAVGLPVEAATPLVGLVGRLADQKGWDLVAEVITRWASTEDVQWVILGRGEPRYHELLVDLARRYPSNVAVQLEFSNELAHRIEAGSDLFLMPSRYEPCGLNQLYSLKYGTVPVVRATGGLADTITDTTADTLESQTANGFSFIDYEVAELEAALRRACNCYRNQQDAWEQVVTTAMRQDWSWGTSAKRYVEIYEAIQQMHLSRREMTPSQDH